jgi:ketosteroid isomerase-like protein
MGTRETARSYFAAWTGRQGPDALRPLMSEDFVFDGGPQRFEGREAVLATLSWPERATTEMLAEAYDGEDAFQLYEATNGDNKVKIVEHLTVRDGRLVASEVITDGAAFMKFMGG